MSPTAPTVIDSACRALEWLIAACLAVMVVMVFGNVVLRYAFNSGIAVSEELSRWLFVWMTFLGALVALREHGHLGTDLLVARLPRRGKIACLVASQLLMLGVTALIFQGSLAQVRINWDVEAPVTGASMAILYAVGSETPSAPGRIRFPRHWWVRTGPRPPQPARPTKQTWWHRRHRRGSCWR